MKRFKKIVFGFLNLILDLKKFINQKPSLKRVFGNKKHSFRFNILPPGDGKVFFFLLFQLAFH